MTYALYAERFGWTPAQVDALPAAVEPWLIPIVNMLDKMRGGSRG